MSPRGSAPSPSAADLPVAIDAMGGDKAPAEIVAGARRAADEADADVSVNALDCFNCCLC